MIEGLKDKHHKGIITILFLPDALCEALRKITRTESPSLISRWWRIERTGILTTKVFIADQTPYHEDP